MRVFFSNRAQFPSPPLTKHRLTNRKEAGAVYTPVGHYDFSFLPPPIRVINIVADPWQLSCLVFSLSLSLSATRPFRHDTVTTREHKVSSQFHASPPRPFFSPPRIRVARNPWLHYFINVNGSMVKKWWYTICSRCFSTPLLKNNICCCCSCIDFLPLSW